MLEVNLREKGTMVQALWDSVNETTGNLSIVASPYRKIAITGRAKRVIGKSL